MAEERTKKREMNCSVPRMWKLLVWDSATVVAVGTVWNLPSQVIHMCLLLWKVTAPPQSEMQGLERTVLFTQCDTHVEMWRDKNGRVFEVSQSFSLMVTNSSNQFKWKQHFNFSPPWVSKQRYCRKDNQIPFCFPQSPETTNSTGHTTFVPNFQEETINTAWAIREKNDACSLKR